MRIIIDARIGDPRMGGIGRYTHELLARLAARLPMARIIALTHGTHAVWPHVQTIEVRGSARSLGGGFLCVRIMRHLRPDLVHILHPYLPLPLAAPTVVTVHDRIPVLWPDQHAFPAQFWYTGVRAIQRQLWWNRIGRTTHIITNSPSTTRDLVYAAHIAPGRITTIPLAADHIDHQPCSSSLHPRPYLLILGDTGAHKNFSTLLSAYAELRAAGMFLPDLVHAGPNNRTSRQLHKYASALGLTRGSNSYWYEYQAVSDADLAGLIAHATALIQPALYEGFALQAAEAVRLGVPVLASEQGSLPEVVGSHGRYFNPADTARIKSILVMTNRKYNLPPPSPRCCLVHQRTWDEVADNVRDCYLHVLAAHH